MNLRALLMWIVPLALVASSTAAHAGMITGYIESGGQVVGEAEMFSSRAANMGEIEWVVRPDENGGTTPQDGGPIVSNARDGSYVQSLPDEDPTGGGGPLALPEITYEMLIGTTGTYRLYVRWDGNDTSGGSQGRSDSLFADIVELKDGTGMGGGPIADWYELAQGVNGNFASPAWDGGGEAEANEAGPANNPMVWDITSPGIYTLRFTAREDGSAVDAFVFQLNSLAAPTGNGPATSALIIPEPTTALLGLLVTAGVAAGRRRRTA